MEAKTVGVFGLTDDADIIEWVRQYADTVAILGDLDKWCGGLTLTNRNKVGVNVKHYVIRTKVEVLEKVVERVPHLSSEVSEQFRIFYRHVVDCGELHKGAPTETKVKTEEETGAIPDTSRQIAVPVSSKQHPASLEQVSNSSSSSSSSGGVQVVGVRPDTTLAEKKRKQYKDLVVQISGLDAERGADKLRILDIQKEENDVMSSMPKRNNFPEGSEGKEEYATELASWAEKKEVFDVVFDAGKADRDMLVATLQGHIDQLASDVFVLNEQADKLCEEIDALSPPP
uniref:Uncharacterized protein n=1 Tax=Chromera velia CCMP2878 TaxID=1169474 RepID=A0A0G4FTL0_9ALVE|eukprot:Cvel_18694.t1-p1 / transcript=Cvel_18694.t1 / gene=Cvel_18694 / organism=Chromera_velia_CCMP2878 / gene_product=hypothetical protein / transcript_product=hypothetical protein / location=Cvel_scaffold1566:9287-10376(+) / protein_length=285 / sequence_SO=supercontig / SO=protein_coding / is_pseudo=false